MSTFPVRELNENQVLFAEGTRGSTAYILKKGEVEVSIRVGEKKVVLTRLRPPAVFGEMALLLTGHKRTATVRALEPTEVVEINSQAFEDYLEKSPPVISTVLTGLAARLQDTTRKAAHAPDIFQGISETLNLLSVHGMQQIFHDDAIRGLSRAFMVDPTAIKELLAMMEDMGLIELQENQEGKTIISIPHKESFPDRARRIYETFRKFS